MHATDVFLEANAGAVDYRATEQYYPIHQDSSQPMDLHLKRHILLENIVRGTKPRQYKTATATAAVAIALSTKIPVYEWNVYFIDHIIDYGNKFFNSGRGFELAPAELAGDFYVGTCIFSIDYTGGTVVHIGYAFEDIVETFESYFNGHLERSGIFVCKHYTVPIFKVRIKSEWSEDAYKYYVLDSEHDSAVLLTFPNIESMARILIGKLGGETPNHETYNIMNSFTPVLSVPDCDINAY